MRSTSLQATNTIPGFGLYWRTKGLDAGRPDGQVGSDPPRLDWTHTLGRHPGAKIEVYCIPRPAPRSSVSELDMKLLKLNQYVIKIPSFPRKREPRGCKCSAGGPLFLPGQALGPRFRGGDDTLLRLAATSRVRFSGGRTVDFELPCHDAPSGNFGVKKLSKPPCRGVLEAS